MSTTFLDDLNAIRRRYHEHLDANRFTRRELQIITFIRGGRTSREIANLLYISMDTVGVHRSSIMNKLGNPRARLSALINNGII